MATKDSGFWRCLICSGGSPHGGIFRADSPRCPRCRCEKSGLIQEIVPVHFMAVGSGPIQGTDGPQHVACDPNRRELAVSPEVGDLFSATGDPRAVTCPDCRGTPAWKSAAAYFLQMKGQRGKAQGRFIIDPREGGCCE